jgi:anaerobic selenocysteine-containing dehydrogenase
MEEFGVTQELKRSVCPYDCPDACGMLVEVAAGKAVRVAGDPDHPHTRGSLCPKMAHYERTVHSSDRLTQPLVRTGPKGTGQFRPVSWEEAVGTITERWQRIITEYGPEAILPYSYAGTMGMVQRNVGDAFFYRLGASQLERALCSPAKSYGWSAVMGGTIAPHPAEAAESDFIILWGTNALATNIHLLQFVREAKQRGAKVWLIETYESPTAATADRTITVRPGSDGALALGMMHVLQREGLIDTGFIDDHVQGFDQLCAEILPQYTPEFVSGITGCPASVIEELARAYGRTGAPFISLGSGLSRYGNGAMTVRTIVCLPAVVGAWKKAGGGILCSTSSGSALPVNRVARPDFLRQPTRIINTNQLGEALKQADHPPIKSLYVYHSNPATIAPDQNAVIQGLTREDLFTVVHERFMTDTALYADVILPATTSLEHSDIYRAYGHYCVQRAYPVIPPVGEAKSNWDTFALLAAALGIDDPFFQQTADDIVETLLNPPAPWLQGADLEKLRDGKPVELPLPEGYKLQYKTPSGRIEIYNPRETDPLPCYNEPHGDKEPFWLVNPPSLYSLNSSFGERADLLGQRGEITLMMNPADANEKGFTDGQRVVAFNSRGEVEFILEITEKAPGGVVVTEGVYWMQHNQGKCTVNALVSQRLTDKAAGSTFYDVKVDVRGV